MWGEWWVCHFIVRVYGLNALYTCTVGGHWRLLTAWSNEGNMADRAQGREAKLVRTF